MMMMMMKYYYHCTITTLAIQLITTITISSSFVPFLNHLSSSITTANSQTNINNKSYVSVLYAAASKKPKPPNKKKNNDIGDDSSKKAAALAGVLDLIDTKYGRGSLIKLGDATNMNVESIKSGSLTLDVILGGGYPKGRIIEIYGPESAGKTTLALHAIASVQNYGGTAAFIDAEHALDPVYAENIGVDVDGLLVSQPECGEIALDIVDQLVRSNAVDVIVIDSVAALVPRAELDGDMSDMQIGLQARLMSKAMRKIVGSLAVSKCTVIFLNQLRSKVGVFYGSNEVTSGGNALKFYASVRLDTRRKEMLPDNTGIRVKIKTVKNKVYAPFQTVEIDILFGTGIDSYGSLFDAALTVGCIERKGSWYSYDNINFAQGRGNGIEYMKKDGEFCKTIEKLTSELTMIQSNEKKAGNRNVNNSEIKEKDEVDESSIIDDIVEEETISE